MLFTVPKIAKILMAVLLFLLLLRKCVQLKKTYAFRAGLAAAVLLFACLAQFASSVVPPVTDTVVLTALGEKREKATDDAVYLSGFVIDGKKYQTDSRSLQVISGKWFWGGNKYCWRDEADERQPGGTTRSVTIALPAGRDRSLLFSTGRSRGYVEIQSGGMTKTVDTSRTSSEKISPSSRHDLILNQVRGLLAFSAVMLAGAVGLYFVTRNTEKSAAWAKKHKWHLIYAAIAAAQFIFAICHSEVISFWTDEMYEIGWSEKSSGLLERMLVDHVPRPIYSFFFYFWYKIVPYGEKWFLLPMEAATAIGIYFCAVCAKTEWDGKAGMFAASFAAISSVTLTQLSYEIRSYPFYFCFGAILLYLFLRRWKHPGHETVREMILTCVVMILFAGMHAHAVIICVLFFCIDVYMHIRYKTRFSSYIPYFAAGVSYIPVIIVTIRNIRTGEFNLDTFWTSVPNVSLAIGLIKYLCSKSEVVMAFFLLAVAWLACSLINRTEKTNTVTTEKAGTKEILGCLLLVCFGHILIMFVYGNLRTQTTLWANRYFIGLCPIVYMLGACCTSAFCDWTGGLAGKGYLKNTAAVFVMLFLFFTGYQDLVPNQAPMVYRFRESADYLYSQSASIYNSDTIVLATLSGKDTPIIGWDQYYMQQKGRRDPVNVVTTYDLAPEDLEPYQKVYAVNFHGRKLNDQIQKYLDTEFTVTKTSSDVPVVEYTRKQASE